METPTGGMVWWSAMKLLGVRRISDQAECAEYFVDVILDSGERHSYHFEIRPTGELAYVQAPRDFSDCVSDMEAYGLISRAVAAVSHAVRYLDSHSLEP